MKKQWVVALLLLVVAAFLLVKYLGNVGKEEGNVIKIGAILPLTGVLAPIGIPEKNLLELTVNELNSQNNQFKYELFVEDSKGKPSDGVNGVNKLLNVDNVDILFVSLTNITKAVLPMTQNKGIPVFANSMSSDLVNIAKNVFRIFPSTNNEANIWYREIIKNNYKKPAFLYINTDYALEERRFLEDSLQKTGIPLLSESFEMQTKDFKTSILKFKVSGCDVIIISGLGVNYPVIVNQTKELKLNIPILGDIDFGLALAKNEANQYKDGLNIYNGISFAMVNIDADDKEFREISSKYKGAYNTELLEESEAAYFSDALRLVNAKVEKNTEYSISNLISNLTNVNCFDGISGNFSISNRSANIPLSLAKFVDGKIIIIQNNKIDTPCY